MSIIRYSSIEVLCDEPGCHANFIMAGARPPSHDSLRNLGWTVIPTPTAEILTASPDQPAHAHSHFCPDHPKPLDPA